MSDGYVWLQGIHYPADSYLFKVNDKNTRKSCKNVFKVNNDNVINLIVMKHVWPRLQVNSVISLISNHLLFSLGSDSYKKIQLFKVHGKKFCGKSPLWDHSYCTYAVFWKFCARTKWMITISISWLSFICFFQSRLFYTGEVTNVYVFQLLIV